MTRSVLPSVLLILATTCALAAGDLGATPQLLRNIGFEDGAGPTAADWGLWPPPGQDPGVSSTRDEAVRHSGRYSGRLQIGREDFTGLCTWHHPAVPVVPGQELVLSFWLRAEGVTGRLGCDVQLRTGTKIVGSAALPETKGTFDWKPITHRFIVPAGIDGVCVVPLLAGKGTAWFDDFALYGTPTLTPLQVTRPPVIDGDLSDACWTQQPGVGGFALAGGSGAPQRATTVWAATDPTRLYFAFRCEKKPGDKLVKKVTQRDGVVWSDDEVELFLNPAGNFGDYYQFIVNPLGTRYDSHLTDASWNANWQAKTRETSEAWTVELALPLASFPVDLGVGQTWCANFGRGDKLAGEASSWSCTFGGFHSPARFGRLLNLGLDLAPYYARDARVLVGAVRRDYDEAVGGLDLAGAPAAVAAPVRERQPRLAAGLQQLEALLHNPGATTPEQWAQVRPVAAQLTADVRELKSASLRLRAYTFWSQGAATAPRFGLATASPMVKLRPDGVDAVATVSRELSVAAAGNEYEAAQIVAVSLSDEELAGCEATVTDLTGPGGAQVAARNLTLRVVGYIATGQPKYATAYVGDWPDPLLPNGPFTLKPGRLQPLWLRVYVPPQTRPGDYRGTVTVRAGQESHELALKLHVFGFDLPRRQHLATPFGCAPATLSQWYTGDPDYATKLPPEVFDRWNRFMLDYRLTPTHVGAAYRKTVRDAAGRLHNDYTLNDRCMAAVADRLPRQGVAIAHIGEVGWACQQGSDYQLTSEAHSGKLAALLTWPKTESWASTSRSLPGDVLAERQCRAFRFWVKALDPVSAKETIVAFVNRFPNRWITTFPVGGTEWHEVRIPVAQYHHNTTGAPLTLEGLKTCDNFQFVISGKKQPIRFLLDDVVAECEGGDVVLDNFEAAGRKELLQAQVGDVLDHFRQKGWLELGHVYAKDEIQPAEYERLLPIYRETAALAKNVPLMQTYYINRQPQALVGPVKLWCAITSIFDDAFLAARRKAGETAWLYVCCGPLPPYANFFIDQPGSDHRVLFWQAWQKQCTGLLYWETNYWHGMLPAEATAPRWPAVPWDQTKVATYREFKVNGDGFLIYPGPDWQPWPSVRLENIRDGIEDYEYLWLLRERNPRSPLLTVGEDISRDFTHFTKDPQVIAARRLAIARELERAGKR